MARAQGARAQLALGLEVVYGTAPEDGNFIKMPFASTTLGSEQPLLSSELLGYGRDPLPPVKDAITADGDVVVPVDPRFFGIWLSMLFGFPTTSPAGALFRHVFTSGQYDLPSASIEVGNPEVPSYRMLSGVKANTLNWSMQRSGLLTATVGCLAQGEEPSSAVPQTGALVEFDQSRFSSFNGSIRRGSDVLGNVVSGTITYSNGLEPVETIRSDGKIDGADEGMATLSGEVVMRFADTAMLDVARDGEAIELTFGYAMPGGAMFELIAHAVYLPVPRIPQTGPAGVQATFAWQAARGLAGGPMVTARLVNDRPTYTPVP